MRLLVWLPFAAISALSLVCAATRPHYGGVLRVEINAVPPALDAEAGPLASLVFEPLVRLDAAGTPQPCLALAWQHDAAFRRWQFMLRPGVKFHDGFALVPAAVVASLQLALPGTAIAANADGVTIRTDHPMPGLLLDLAYHGLVFAHDAEGGLTGTGPFRVASWDAGRHATLTANDDYWGGRPFLDSIEITLGRSLQNQLVDLEIGKTDVAEIAPASVRHAADRGRTVWSSAPIRLVALVFVPGRAPDPRLREALALSIDRAAMHNVLLLKQGEPSAALLPQWISGYAFAFPVAPDVARARALAAALPPPARAVALTYDPAIVVARPLAERIAVNARDVGLTAQVSAQNPTADLRLVEIRLSSLDPARALAGFAAALGLDPPLSAANPETLYEAERRLLEDGRVIPLFHLPELYGVETRLHLFQPPPVSRSGGWRFENLWLSGTAP